MKSACRSVSFGRKRLNESLTSETSEICETSVMNCFASLAQGGNDLALTIGYTALGYTSLG